MSLAPPQRREAAPLDGLAAAAEPGGAAGETRLRVELAELGAVARALRDDGARFITMLIAEAPERSLALAVALRGELIALRAPLPERAQVASIGAWWPAARWAERELVELHGLPVAGAADGPALTRPDADRLDRTLDGLDVFSLPYGPVRSGVFEAIQFEIETGGEDVPRIQTRPFFKRRAMEARFVGLAPHVGVHVAERVAGIASCAYAAAFSQAVERALGVQAPQRALCLRAVHCELERIACHLDVIAKEAETTALYVGQARFQILKEQIMRLRTRLSGSRFGRGVIVPGGVREQGAPEHNALGHNAPRHDAPGPDVLRAALDRFERELRRDRRMFLGTASMTDRLIGAGRLDRTLLEDYGAVGPLTRGSGISADARHERPYGNYVRLGAQVVTERDGDAMARVRVRFGEIAESLRLLRQTLDQLRRHDGEARAALPSADGAAFGWVEAPQGELLIWVELRDGIVRRVHIASPSLRNWALFDHAFPKDVLTDFAFIEHSFGLTPAGADR